MLVIHTHMTTYHPYCNQHQCYHTPQVPAINPHLVGYGEWNPDGTHSVYILKNPHMNWEDELQEQKDERDISRNLWNSILVPIGGAVLLSGWYYIVTQVFRARLRPTRWCSASATRRRSGARQPLAVRRRWSIWSVSRRRCHCGWRCWAIF